MKLTVHGSRNRRLWLAVAPLTLCAALAETTAAKPLPVLRPARTEAVDFDREILPVFRANCLPCHNKTTSKADLLLETPADMLRGGESGAALVPGKSADSLVFRSSAHLEKPRMPPKENKVNAVNLTPEELGLLALWIDQGAKPSAKREEIIAWQSLPPPLGPILAVAITADGRYGACGRGNALEVYRLPSGQPLARLADPALANTNAPFVAHRDLVNALAFSPDGTWLASGGFREVKLWRRTFPLSPVAKAPPAGAANNPSRRLSPDGQRALWLTNGLALLGDAEGRRFVVALTADPAASFALAASERSLAWARGERDAAKADLESVLKELETQRGRRGKAAETLAAADKALGEKEPVLVKARAAMFEAELAFRRTERRSAGFTNGAALRKAAADKLDVATKAVEQAEQELKAPRQKRSSARDELDLATAAGQRAEATLLSARWKLQAAETAVVSHLQAVQRAIAASNRGVAPAVDGVFSPDGQLVATTHADGVVRLWSAADGAAFETVPVGTGIQTMVFTDASTLAVKTTAEGWRCVNVRPTWTLERTLGPARGGNPFADRITALAFRGDGLRLASGGGEPTRGGDIQVWDPATGALLYAITNLHSDSVLSLAWSPDGARLISGGADRFARLVDTASGRPVRSLEGHTGHVLGVAWSPDGLTLATAGADLVVKLWNARTGEKRKDITGFGREVTAVSFLENDRRLVAASGEGELRLLNEKGERQAGFKGPTDFTYAAGTTADGVWLLGGGQDGKLRLWHQGEPEPRWQIAEDAVWPR